MDTVYERPSSSAVTPRLHRPPMMPGGLPLLGHALEMRNDPVGLMSRGRDMFGDIFRIKLPGSTGVVMTGPRAQEKYFRLSDEDVSQAEAYQLMTPIFGKGLAYDAAPPVMKEQLGFFHVALRDARMRTYGEGFIEEAETYFGKWGDEGTVQMYEIGNELTIYTSSRSLLGKAFRESLSDEFAKLYQDMEGGLNLLAFFNPNLPLVPAFRKRDKARARLVEMITEIIEQRRNNPGDNADMLQSLIEARYSDGRALTEDEITGLLLTIMFAGHHTSGVTFSWTGILLAQHPEWMARLREEQRRVLGKRTQLTYEDLKEMTLLEATIKEVLRIYPPIIMMMRKVVNPFSFDGYDVVPGDMIFAVPAVAHFIPEVFSDPHRFDPERFLPERAEDKKHPMAWLSFGAGRHRCMGIMFAQLQLRALWSHLLRNFDFETMEDKYEPDYTRLLVGPKHPCRLRYRRISDY